MTIDDKQRRKKHLIFNDYPIKQDQQDNIKKDKTRERERVIRGKLFTFRIAMIALLEQTFNLIENYLGC
jgi:hypothetical protein